MTTCAATRKKDGEPCDLPIVADSGYCWAHNPAYAAARAKGGRNRATAVRLTKIMPLRLVPVWDQLETALADVLAGRLDSKRASAAAAVGRALCAILQAGELEERLRRLEERGA